MVRLFSSLLVSLVATCSVLGALQPGIYEILYQDLDLTFHSQGDVVTFETPGGGDAQLWNVSFVDTNLLIVQSTLDGEFLYYNDTQPGTPLRGWLDSEPAPFLVVEQPEGSGEYILYPNGDTAVAVGQSDENSDAVLKSTESEPVPRLTFKQVQ